MQIFATDQPLKFVEQNISKKALLLDAEKVKFPLRIRNWNNGDRMQPLGMTGSQKISDILVNHKVSIINKTKALVLESDDQILWLVGYKPSKHHKITSQTKRVIIIWLAD